MCAANFSSVSDNYNPVHDEADYFRKSHNGRLEFKVIYYIVA